MEDVMNRSVPWLTAATFPVALLLGSGVAFAEQPPPIDSFVQFLFGSNTQDACHARVLRGFQKAGYANIAQMNGSAVKGVIQSGDNAGVSSMAVCFSFSPAGADFQISVSSAGRSSLGEATPNAQNSRLLSAINTSQ
jgi:hypothetical protein